MNISSLKICVCGAGTMGSGIALAFALHGCKVILFDTSEGAIASAAKRTEQELGALAAKNRISAADRIADRIQYSSSIADCVADLVIEAVVENADIKASLLNNVAAINGPDTIYATNTSSLSVTAIAERFSRKSQLAGMHFFNPATIMKLVEVVETKYSSPDVLSKLESVVAYMGKTPVRCQDAPGFIVNHVARPYYLEALHLAEKYGVPIDAVDALLESSGFRMGPFRLMDLIGNDINYSVSCIVYSALGKPERLKPSSLQKEKVDTGRLGRKSGRGYYEYEH